jgi:hypothetical protein
MEDPPCVASNIQCFSTNDVPKRENDTAVPPLSGLEEQHLGFPPEQHE